MTRTNRTILQWECQQFLSQVMTLTDNGEWRKLADCYTENARLFRPSDPKTAIIGHDAIYQSFLGRPPRVTCHLLTNCVFDVVSDTKVRASSRVLLTAGEPADTGIALADTKIMLGSFVDDLVYINERWLIEQRLGSVELKYQP